MPNFETFTKRMVPLVKSPSVTIQRRGTMSMNKAAHVALGAPEAVELLFDPSERIVGFRGIDKSAGHAYLLRSTPGDSSYILSGIAFINYYMIDISESKRYDAKFEDGVLFIDLKVDGQIVSINRKSRAEPSEDSEPFSDETASQMGSATG